MLIDAGGEYGYYSADITRTFPVGKDYSPAQAEIYDLVLKTQEECIAMTKPGVAFHDIDKHAKAVLVDGLLSLGCLKGDPKEILKDLSYKKFYPHNTGHWLGMDVHDVGLYTKNGESRILEEGMYFTIEPGLYFQPGDTGFPEKYAEIGIRIEDDILVTANGSKALTAKVPKKREEVLALR